MELESKVNHYTLPHPSTNVEVDYELLEDPNTDSLNVHQASASFIYTDGSKIDGKVGAAVTWWKEGKETASFTYSLHPACTVFQSELYALNKATEMVKSSKDKIVYILSDSRSSLDLLRNPKITHPLARGVKDNIGAIRAEKREVRLVWLRAHVGTAGNERADELAKAAALKQGALDYNKIPLSHVKNTIRKESILKWQDTYDTSSTGGVTKLFLPNVDQAYRIVRGTRLTHYQVQALTGHGGIADYLYRYHLIDNPGCECDSAISETVEHVVVECPRFSSLKYDLEFRLGTQLSMSSVKTIMQDRAGRAPLLEYLHQIFRRTTARTTNLTQQPTTTTTTNQITTLPTSTQSLQVTAPLQILYSSQLLNLAETGSPGIRLRSVVTFMDNNNEKLGISFCIKGDRKHIAIAPGLAYLLKGSTTKTTLKRKIYLALPEVELFRRKCRLVRVRNKTIVLFEWSEDSSFRQASTVLSELGRTEDRPSTTPRVISVDAMMVGFDRGKVSDRLGCISASKLHEVIVYEDRGEDLNYLVTAKKTETKPTSEAPTQSGSEILQQKIIEDQARNKIPERKTTIGAVAKILTQTITRIIKPKTSREDKLAASAESFLLSPPKPTTSSSRRDKTRADKGEVSPPILLEASDPHSHTFNAFLEFVAITKANLQVNTNTCKKIMQAYEYNNTGLLDVLLKENEAAIYDNSTSKVIMGTMEESYMAAYNATSGFVASDAAETERKGRPHFNTPPSDSIVVTARCTLIMPDDKILGMADTVTADRTAGTVPEGWAVPHFEWVNGVPGCGKTYWVMQTFNEMTDVIATTTLEAAKELKEKLALKIGNKATHKVRTIASILANGFRESDKPKRLIIDEALMNHFGAIVMVARLSGADDVILIGDVNQLPYIDRNNLFEIKYSRPNSVVNITQELLCTRRNPLDVAFALKAVYSGIYSSNTRVRSMELHRLSDMRIPKDQSNTLFLTYTQEEKESLNNEGFGSGEGSRVLTIHESQGLTFPTVVILQTKPKQIQIHCSVPHAVVALTRHTERCYYYTDLTGGAIGRILKQATSATHREIVEYNLKMAIWNGDDDNTIKLSDLN